MGDRLALLGPVASSTGVPHLWLGHVRNWPGEATDTPLWRGGPIDPYFHQPLGLRAGWRDTSAPGSANPTSIL